MKLVAISTLIVLTILAFATWSSYREHILPFPQPSSKSKADVPDDKSPSNSLAEFALSKVLNDAAPIFGHYSNVQTDTSNWMAAYPDETWLVHMNLPGTHDAATWNYSAATQRSTTKITNLVSNDLSIDNSYFRCQDGPLIAMLNAGIRVFDLRYAFDVTNSSVVFWHSVALLSETASLESVLFGFYKWLDDHPTEALFVSLQFEGVEVVGNVDGPEVQRELYRILTNDAARRYVSQARDRLGTLGDARGLITLLRRFDLNELDSENEVGTPGVHFSPKKWPVNGPNTELVYNPSPSSGAETGRAYIQDYYQPATPADSSLWENIDDEMTKITAHFDRAMEQAHQNDLFWHFLSSTNIDQNPPKTPRTMALGSINGNEVGIMEVQGVNDHVLSVFGGMKGKRLGIVMFDFFEQPSELLPLFLSLLPPEDANEDSGT